DVRPAKLEEAIFSARDPNKRDLVDPMNLSLGDFRNTTPNEKGEFVISLLRPGVQRMNVELPGEHLYLKSTTLAQPDPKAKPIDVAKSGITLKSGDKLKGLVVTMSEGAAGLRGKLVTGDESKPPSVKMRAHLIPFELE